eukprot:CAMPEP_0175150198 /NCGR_PEP_ID=MMETSP0087-20121206/17727_1 /TAXON_ID=136419 /ORGANISM="Unknown Unknown, Strain D1" /LENGTH=662 /DNA_ID=CAMNT_0016436097 /DNA_START=44 /DNA_END=2032 /DNA_ORIENTATION=+
MADLSVVLDKVNALHTILGSHQLSEAADSEVSMDKVLGQLESLHQTVVQQKQQVEEAREKLLGFFRVLESCNDSHLDATNEALISSLHEYVPADHAAIYFAIGKSELCGLEIATSPDPFCSRRIRLATDDVLDAGSDKVSVHMSRVSEDNATSVVEYVFKNRECVVLGPENALLAKELQSVKAVLPNNAGYDMTSLCCAPVLDEDGSVLAVVEVVKSNGAYGPADLGLVKTLCDMMTVTIRRILPAAVIDSVKSNTNTDAQEKSEVTSMLDRYKDNGTTRKRGLSYQVPEKIHDPLFNPKLRSTKFNCWDFTESDLMRFTIGIFEDSGVLNDINISRATLTNFVLGVRKRYRNNPFHNFYHAFSVLQFAYLCVRRTDATSYLLADDVLAFLIASLCHDIDHPGNTNAFEINGGTARALVYNDISVLENHHAHKMFTVMYNDRANLFSGLSREQHLKLRSTMVKAILATDMTQHFSHLKKMDAVAVNNNKSSGSRLGFDSSNDADRQFIINSLIHTADLSGQVYPWTVATVWEERISKEFEAQAAMEEKHGLPVMPFMTGLQDIARRAKMQVNFIDFVLHPWWKGITRIFPQFETLLQSLIRNRDRYENRSKGLPDAAEESSDGEQEPPTQAENDQNDENEVSGAGVTEEKQESTPASIEGKP